MFILSFFVDFKRKKIVFFLLCFFHSFFFKNFIKKKNRKFHNNADITAIFLAFILESFSFSFPIAFIHPERDELQRSGLSIPFDPHPFLFLLGHPPHKHRQGACFIAKNPISAQYFHSYRENRYPSIAKNQESLQFLNDS